MGDTLVGIAAVLLTIVLKSTRIGGSERFQVDMVSNWLLRRYLKVNQVRVGKRYHVISCGHEEGRYISYVSYVSPSIWCNSVVIRGCQTIGNYIRLVELKLER